MVLRAAHCRLCPAPPSQLYSPPGRPGRGEGAGPHAHHSPPHQRACGQDRTQTQEEAWQVPAPLLLLCAPGIQGPSPRGVSGCETGRRRAGPRGKTHTRGREQGPGRGWAQSAGASGGFPPVQCSQPPPLHPARQVHPGATVRGFRPLLGHSSSVFGAGGPPAASASEAGGLLIVASPGLGRDSGSSCGTEPVSVMQF